MLSPILIIAIGFTSVEKGHNFIGTRNVLNHSSTTFAAVVLVEKQLGNSLQSLKVAAARHRSEATNSWLSHSITRQCVSPEMGDEQPET